MMEIESDSAGMMTAFHDDPHIKEYYLERVRAHRAADDIIRGVYWQGGKGCAVGCTIHGSDHGAYERELGIPQAIAYLEDCLFEGLPQERVRLFPEEFLEAIPVGSDLGPIVPHFLLWLLVDPQHGVMQHADARGRAAIAEVATLLRLTIDGVAVSDVEWSQATAAAGAASVVAYAAAAGWAAGAAGWAAEAAAGAAAEAAAEAAEAAAEDAEAAAGWAAEAAAEAAAEVAAAWRSSYVAMADRLIALLREAPVGAGV